MCGRYSFAVEDELIRERFGVRVRTAIYKANYNCSPTQKLAVITNREPDVLNFYRWGLIPSWAKDPAIGNRMFNARAETIGEKPSFRDAFRRRRCLVPATGFYEWKAVPGTKKRIPVHFGLSSGEPFSMAGLWEEWTPPGGETVHSFTIITTAPNERVAPVHDRMPVILRREDEPLWLSPSGDIAAAGLLVPFPAEMMEDSPVTWRLGTGTGEGH